MKVAKDIKPSKWDEIYNIKFKFVEGKKGSKSCDSLMAFDIETSNGWRQSDGSVIGFDHDLYNNDEKYRKKIDNGDPVSLLYVWQFAIESEYPVVFMGRTWEEYEDFIRMLTTEVRRQSFFGIKSVNRQNENQIAQQKITSTSMQVYIHNAGFEMQHLRNIWEHDFSRKSKYGGSVFARKARKPMKFTVRDSHVRIEFRDSLVLTQKSLSAWCKDAKLPVQKLQEPKDYYLPIRTPKTPLTDEEIQYSINDVVSMLYGLEQYRDKYGHQKNIPLTQTGAVRNTCRMKVCAVNPSWADDCASVSNNYTPQRFKDLCNLFQGGWTHGNKIYIGKTLKNIKCFDFASSYPAVMTTRRYPLTDFEKWNTSRFHELESLDVHTSPYRWYAKIKVDDVISSKTNSYWSLSKVCVEDKKPQIKGQIVDNGRIFSADTMTIMVTDLDWDTFKQAYNIYGKISVQELYVSKAGYLATELIMTILEYFEYKTSLKGDPDKESLYIEAKQFINSIYGCAVTKIIMDLVEFANGWQTTPFDDEMFYSAISKMKPENTFISYQAGVWVTAWARHNLWDFILKMDKRVVYCDTDSIKGLFTDEDLAFIDEYNKGIADLEEQVAATLGFNPDMFTPKTLKGKTKRLGIMEREEDCEEFKTLGAKRYVDLIDGKIHCTIAGLPKRAGEAKIKSVDEFTDNLVWNTKESEKLIANYNDNQQPCMWYDRDGKSFYSADKYGVCLQPTTFDLSMGEEFRKFLQMLEDGDIDKEDEFYSDTPGYLLR